MIDSAEGKPTETRFMIQLAKDLLIPAAEVATQKFAFLGSNGSGKSYAATKLGEEMLKAGIQIIAIDPVGIWHGLRRNADGSPSKFNVLVFGGLHGDLPLTLSMAKAIAHLAVSERLSIVLDLKLLRRNDRKKFAAAFADEFHHGKAQHRSPVHLFLEEAQNFVPQRLRSGDRDDALAAFYAIATEGRNDGIGITLISPSPQDVDKRVLNLSQCLLAFRLTGPQECEAIQKWIGRQRFSNEPNINTLLPTLEVGQPYVWSPGWLKHSGIVKIEPKQSYDTSSSPSHQTLTELPKLPEVDLETVRSFLEQFDENAEFESIAASQPQIAQLKREIAALKSQLQSQSKQIERIEVPVFRAGEIEQMWSLVDQLMQVSEQTTAIAQTIVDNLTSRFPHIESSTIRSIQENEASLNATPSIEIDQSPCTQPEKPEPAIKSDLFPTDFIPKPPQQRMINVLGELLLMGVDRLTLQNLAILSEQSPTSSNPSKFARQLIEAELLQQLEDKTFTLTEAGKQIVEPEKTTHVRSQADLHQRWIKWLDQHKQYGNGHARFLQFLIKASIEGRSLSKKDLTLQADYSLTSSGPAAKLRDLEELGLIEKDGTNSYRVKQFLLCEFPTTLTE